MGLHKGKVQLGGVPKDFLLLTYKPWAMPCLLLYVVYAAGVPLQDGVAWMQPCRNRQPHIPKQWQPQHERHAQHQPCPQ